MAQPEELARKIDAYFQGNVGRRLYIQLDKPLYKPGESIWVRAWDLRARDLAGAPENPGIKLELVSPKGAVVATKLAQAKAGFATSDFELSDDLVGGEYTIRVSTLDGVAQAERPAVISTYEAPRLKKTLEFIRKAYGEGDEVTATIEVKRSTGEPMANKQLTGLIRLDEQDLPRVSVATDSKGAALVRFTLPTPIAVGDGLLTVLVEDGGVTESISKRIPIIVRKMQLAFFPEGGNLVQGLPSRLYFEAKTPLNKPADVEGRVVDDLGNAVALFRSYKNGLGRVAFTPATGRTYHAEITQPVGIAEKFALPIATEQGCVLRSFDDLDGALPELRIAVSCTETRTVTTVAMLRDNVIDAATVEAKASEPTIISLHAKDESLARAQGIARVTLFDESMNPLAERLVYRNRRNRLLVQVTPDKKSYAPRDPVALQIATSDASGKPVSADLALSVVDDTVISFADDKTGHLLSRLFLEPELPGKVEEPNFYFDLTEEKSALAMELLMGTRGYRRFEWQPVLNPPPPPPHPSLAYEDVAMAAPMMAPPPAPPRVHEAMKARGGAAHGPLAGPAAAPPAQLAPKDMKVANLEMPFKQEAAKKKADWNQPARARIRPDERMGANRGAFEEVPLQLIGDVAEERCVPQGFAPVRVFPVPTYTSDIAGPRTDFRETIFWAPSVKTDKDGKASVKFFLSDAVTSFRAFAEGVGAGLAGREETVLKSSLPFSLSVKLPVEVSVGDKPLIPVTLANEQGRMLDVSLDASFGSLVKASEDTEHGGALAANARRSLFFPLEVTGTQGESEVHIRATTGGLSDEFSRMLTVTPLGFPQLFSRSGQVKGSSTHSVDLGEAIPGSVTATIKVFPSPVATMVGGMEALLREPSGCFEQTSSSNYPNVMVMQYLKQYDVTDPALLARSANLLQNGYHRLVGYETPQKGYEWFGGAPANEALTAYGLLEFNDMKQVYGDVDSSMVARTTAWLKSRRDGKGGYLRDGKALDSFGRASETVTNAYITYSLVLAGERGLDKEIAAQTALAEETRDPYLLALSAGTLLHTADHRSAGLAAARKLAGMQDAGGSWKGADHSITRSGGQNLEIETTALAILALLDGGEEPDAVRRAVTWLQENRGGFGQWGATQATVLALKALTYYANASRVAKSSGTVSVFVNGERVGSVAYEAGRREPIEFSNFGSVFTTGKNSITLKSEGEELPFTIAIEYRSAKPATSPQSVVDLATTLERATVKMGETVRLNATITNKTNAGQPMTLARIGLPGGLSFQTWQLKELREKGLIAFYETRPREVILYFRDLQPSEVKKIPLDLVAAVPGRYTGPASSAYLYYNDEHKAWADAVSVQIEP